MNRTRRLCRCCIWIAIGGTVFGLFLSGPVFAELPTTILHTFTFAPGDGRNPSDGLILSGSTLYGTTRGGGFPSNGTVFSLDTATNAYTMLHNFSGADDGVWPYGLIQLDSTLYGTTQLSNTLFSLDTATNSETVRTFTTQEGYKPQAGLALFGTTLYGANGAGGALNRGTIFSFDTASSTYAVLHTFSGTANDGQFPEAGLIGFGSTLYGTTRYGKNVNGGTVFSFDTATNTFTQLHSFLVDFSEGQVPSGRLALSGTTLYGVAHGGGAFGYGTIFSVDTVSKKFTLLHSFTGGKDDSGFPVAGLTVSGSTLYGTGELGGAADLGTVFSFDTVTKKFALLHSFVGGSADGASPNSGLVLFGETLFGTTYEGGAADTGVVFAITLPEPSGFFLAAVAGVFCSAVAINRRMR